ncbi:MAG: hypothetical protein WAN43_19345 [Rhodomicrobium sp.]
MAMINPGGGGNYRSSYRATSHRNRSTSDEGGIAAPLAIIVVFATGIFTTGVTAFVFSVLYRILNASPWRYAAFWTNLSLDLVLYAALGLITGLILEWVRARSRKQSEIVEEIIKETGSSHAVAAFKLGLASTVQSVLIGAGLGLLLSYLGLQLGGFFFSDGNLIQPGSALSLALAGAGGGGAGSGPGGFAFGLAIIILIVLIGYAVAALVAAMFVPSISALFASASTAAGRAAGKEIARRGYATTKLIMTILIVASVLAVTTRYYR